MLSVLSAIALVVGSVQATMVLSESDRLAAEEQRSSVVAITTQQAEIPSLHPAAE
jgi:hypothetical protein